MTLRHPRFSMWGFHSAAHVFGMMLILALNGVSLTAYARVTRITIENRESPAYDGKSFGEAGRYEILSGHAYGEIDPGDPHNKLITDIDLAPRNSRGMVEYVATFTLQKPVDLTKANRVLLYAVPNRGNRITADQFSVKGESGNEFLMKRGYMILHSGWQGDLPQRARTENINVPIARNPDGSSITGAALERFSNMPAGTNTLSLPMGHVAASLDTARATLTKQAAVGGAIIPIAGSDWAFSDATDSQFPGPPDPAKISIKGGFDPSYLYELSYTAKDPLVMGIGLAATRDIVSFFRHETQDDTHAINPVAGRVTHVIAQGVSQAGNFIKTFINLGFNEDEAGHIVWDGANPHIAARQLPINFRFAFPGGAADLYEPGSEATLWWGDYMDATRNQPAASLLTRSLASRTCPKIFETFGSAEFWGLRMSPGLVGTKADCDIPLPSNVRRYYFPGTTHGGGAGGFSVKIPALSDRWELPANPNPDADTMRALLVALTEWVTNDVEPPASIYPRLDQGELVRPDHRAMGFPLIPGQPLPDNLINPFYNYDFGTQFNYRDLSGMITIQPPIIKGILPMLVPRVNEDGNETSGIPSVLHQAPLGTYLGWNIIGNGFYKGQGGGYTGGFIPFAKTEAERLAKGDPRLSLEERYHNHAGYVVAVKKAAAWLVAGRFLLPEDSERLVQQAEESNVLK
jgi:Alpha/beta hydrolase domain